MWLDYKVSDFQFTGRLSLLPSQHACFDEESCHIGEAYGKELSLTSGQQPVGNCIPQPDSLQKMMAAHNSWNRGGIRFFTSWAFRWNHKLWANIFKKNFYLFFNLRIIALQNFVAFCQISTWISHRYTYIPCEMYVESNMETYITMCKVDSQWEFAVCLRRLK